MTAYSSDSPILVILAQSDALALTPEQRRTLELLDIDFQSETERLFGWAKSAAIVTGVPLALLAVVLTVLGISNWTDFKNRVAEGKKEIDVQLDTARQSAKEFGEQAATLQAQYADLKKQYGDVS